MTDVPTNELPILIQMRVRGRFWVATLADHDGQSIGEFCRVPLERVQDLNAKQAFLTFVRVSFAAMLNNEIGVEIKGWQKRLPPHRQRKLQ